MDYASPYLVDVLDRLCNFWADTVTLNERNGVLAVVALLALESSDFVLFRGNESAAL